MSRSVLFVLILSILTTFSACSKRDSQGGKAGSQAGNQPAAATKTGESGIAAAVKEKVLPAYNASTIGSAFEGYRYFSNKEWRETRLPKGKTYVDFIGWVGGNSTAVGGAEKGVEIKFAVNPDGEFYVAMISRVEKQSNGEVIRIPLEEKRVILDSIYGNREMSL
jgi:hypothetical protein